LNYTRIDSLASGSQLQNISFKQSVSGF